MKRFSVLFLTLLLTMVLAVPAAMAGVTVYVDNQPVQFDQQPYVDQEAKRTLVPFRAIFESLGANVWYDETTNSAMGQKDGLTIQLPIGQAKALVNGKEATLDTKAQIVNGRTMVPLRFVSENLGCEVRPEGDLTNLTVHITSTAQTQVNGISCKVTRVVDGDTIEVSLNGKTEKVRLIGVDTPETVHPTKGVEPYGKEASDFTKTQLNGQTVSLEFDVQERDHYGRLLAYVWLGDKLFNEVLAKEGYAQVATYPPNVKYVDRFTASQKEAWENNRGLWGLSPGTVTPQSAPQPAPKQPAATSGKYVGSAKSDKYHYPSCRHAEKITTANEVWFKDAADARAHGYVPCGVCKP